MSILAQAADKLAQVADTVAESGDKVPTTPSGLPPPRRCVNTSNWWNFRLVMRQG